MKTIHVTACFGLLSLMIALLAAPGAAQELSPRAYWPQPQGTRVGIAGYSYTWGEGVIDPTLPIEGATSQSHAFIPGYLHTFSIAGRTTNVVVELPYAWGTATGTVQGDSSVTRDFSGPGDVCATLSFNLLGAPSMTPQEFAQFRANPSPILAASVKVVAPTGEYDPEKLVNIGTNRWSIKPELGFGYPLTPHHWMLEYELGAWFFTDNPDFLGMTKEQAPIVAGEFHVVGRIKPGRWASVEFNYFRGGRITLDGQESPNVLDNSRIGATFAWLLTGRHTVKISGSTSVLTGFGNDYDRVILAYNVLL